MRREITSTASISTVRSSRKKSRKEKACRSWPICMGLKGPIGSHPHDIVQHITSFYNRMFKKKGNNNKKLDLIQEAEQIHTNPLPTGVHNQRSMHE